MKIPYSIKFLRESYEEVACSVDNTDEELFEEAKTGNSFSKQVLLARIGPALIDEVVAKAQRGLVSVDEIEDLVNDGFTSVLEHWEDWNPNTGAGWADFALGQAKSALDKNRTSSNRNDCFR